MVPPTRLFFVGKKCADANPEKPSDWPFPAVLARHVEFIRSRVTITKLHEPKLRVRVSTRTNVLVTYIRSSLIAPRQSSSMAISLLVIQDALAIRHLSVSRIHLLVEREFFLSDDKRSANESWRARP